MSYFVQFTYRFFLREQCISVSRPDSSPTHAFRRLNRYVLITHLPAPNLTFCTTPASHSVLLLPDLYATMTSTSIISADPLGSETPIIIQSLAPTFHLIEARSVVTASFLQHPNSLSTIPIIHGYCILISPPPSSSSRTDLLNNHGATSVESLRPHYHIQPSLLVSRPIRTDMFTSTHAISANLQPMMTSRQRGHNKTARDAKT